MLRDRFRSLFEVPLKSLLHCFVITLLVLCSRALQWFCHCFAIALQLQNWLFVELRSIPMNISAESLHSRVAQSLQSLRKSCDRTCNRCDIPAILQGNRFAIAAQSLRKHCANTTQSLRKHCANTAQSLRKRYANAAQTLRKRCANTAQTLLRRCANTAQSPHLHNRLANA